MVLVSDFNIDQIRGQFEEFQLVYPRGTGSNTQPSFKVADNEIYHLRWVMRIEPTRLQSGVEIRGVAGYLISKESDTENWEVGLAFYETSTTYSNIPQELQVTVADAYNATIAGDEVETSESIDPQERREEEAQRQREANQERQREAQRREQETAENEEAEDERLRKQQTVLNEEEVIREQDITFQKEPPEDWIKREFKLQIFQVTKGTEFSPIVTYRFDLFRILNNDDETQRRVYRVTTETQEEAEEIFDNYLNNELPQQFEIYAEQQRQIYQEQEKERELLRIENVPIERNVEKEEVEFYFIESEYSFKQMLEIQGNSIEWDNMPIWKRFLGRGNFNDAVSFSNNNNTLNLDDFDAPRITTVGIQENKSAGVGFTVRRNWRMTFRLKGDSNIKMLKDSKIEGVKEVNSTTFDFTMYSGDRLEIDIDNERENIRPFLVQIKGQEWYSPIEIDDEVSLTLVKAERLSVRYKSGEGTLWDERSSKGGFVFDTIYIDYDGPAYGEYQNKYIEELTEKYPEYEAIENEISSPLGPAESSFTTLEEIVEPVTDGVGGAVDAVGGAVGGAVDSFFSKYRWWIIGGLAVVGLTLFALYRIRNPKVAPPQPVVVAQSPPVQASSGSE